MRKEKVLADFRKIKKTWPDAIISNTLDMILIPEIKLPPKYNLPFTPLLIKIDYYSDYKAPDAYVNRKLRIYGRESEHLAEEFTEDKMLKAGWVKLCIQTEWSPAHSLKDFVILVLKFLKGLER